MGTVQNWKPLVCMFQPNNIRHFSSRKHLLFCICAHWNLKTDCVSQLFIASLHVSHRYRTPYQCHSHHINTIHVTHAHHTFPHALHHHLNSTCIHYKLPPTISIPHQHTTLIISMPQATARSKSPQAMAWDAKCTACCPEPHMRLSWTPGTLIG